MTTDSRHRYLVYPNLARRLIPMAVNQLWVADITYVRLSEEFRYLAVVLDAAFSRTGDWLEFGGSLQASPGAGSFGDGTRRTREVQPGLVHHSDRGVQYACGDYIQRQGRGRHPALDEPPGLSVGQRDGGELMRTLKREEVDGRDYRDLVEAKASDRGGFWKTSITARGCIRRSPIWRRKHMSGPATAAVLAACGKHSSGVQSMCA